MEILRSFTLCVAFIATVAVAKPFAPKPHLFYKLKTKFQGPNRCLEGNRHVHTATLKGAAFMDRCQSVSGQKWQFVPQANGYYRMKTQFQGPRKCLEGNKRAASSTLGGAAFMDNCQNVSGQLWKIKPFGKYFTLTTQFRAPHNECLEGNRFHSSSSLGGAAFMSRCKPFTGQLFYAEVQR